jgi:hypothetical protein
MRLFIIYRGIKKIFSFGVEQQRKLQTAKMSGFIHVSVTQFLKYVI